MTDLAQLIPDGDPLGAYEARLGQGAEPEPVPVRRAWAATRLVMAASYAQVPHDPSQPTPPAELAPHVDWDATAAQRRRLDAAGLGIAEAMDTAQRFRIGWDLARELLERTARLGLTHGFVGGAGVDHAKLAEDASPTGLGRAAAEQARWIADLGGLPILLPFVALGRRRAGAQEHVQAYAAALERSQGPLLVHWLGGAFHPDLAHYFPGDSFQQVMALDRERLVGVKLSLLDAQREVALRTELLQHGQVVLTGDDWNFAHLVEGRGDVTLEPRELAGAPLPRGDFSHALLGVLDGTARAFGLALHLLARGDRQGYRELAALAEAFGRHVFAAPTQAYKTGLAFRAHLAGETPAFLLAGREERLRDRAHLLEVARLAAACGALGEPAAARERLARWLRDAPA